MNRRKNVKSNPKKLEISSRKKSLPPLYEKDFYHWTKRQAHLLQDKDFAELDIKNLIEEIESLGRSEKRALESYLTILLIHLLKIQYQPKKRTKSWDLSVKNSKHKIEVLLKDNPSLKKHLPNLFKEAYFTARLGAAAETNLDETIFPDECPWTIKELIK